MNTAATSPWPAAAVSLTAAWRLGIARGGRLLWGALEAAGRARAHSQLLAFADRCETLQPDLAKELRAATRQGPMV